MNHLPVPFHLSNYKIIPAHKRTIYFDQQWPIKRLKFNLNIPQMLVGFNYLKTYYFPVTIEDNNIYQQYYSPFTNTHSDGSICLGHTLASLTLRKKDDNKKYNNYLDKIVDDIYNTTWKLEILTASFYLYFNKVDVHNHGKTENDYLKFLQNWEQTKKIELKEQQLIKIP